MTFGVQGLSGTGSAVTPSPSLASGVVGPGVLDPGTTGAPTGSGAEALAPSAPTADALALVAYTRSTVETTSKDGVPGELNVASAGLKRPAEGFLMAPLESLSESSPFGLRTSPITGSSGEFHWGQDYAAACGTRVYSADSGVVRAVGWHPWGGGNRVEIDHGNGLITTYNHLEAIAVKKGDSVRVGEVIARVGTTGSSTGCHLHFETILNGSHKNPHDWTLLPITQTDQLGTIDMTSYEPDAGKPSNTSLGWAIPVSEDGTHVVAGGAHEAPASAWSGASDSPSATPTPSTGDALSPTKTRWDTPTPEPSQPSSGSTGETTAPGGSEPPSDTPTPGDPPPPTGPGTTTPPPAETPTPTPTPEPTAPPVPPPPSIVEPAPLPPPPVVEPAPLPPPPPVVEPVSPPPPVVEPAPPPPPAPEPEPEPTSAPAPPTQSTEPSATTDPSLTPGP
ncbi:MAG TPA: M23 family metallopeptidase [Arthrobacter sp.]|nr:M23 family metallopeptidase [Arthrobacter sp.]